MNNITKKLQKSFRNDFGKQQKPRIYFRKFRI